MTYLEWAAEAAPFGSLEVCLFGGLARRSASPPARSEPLARAGNCKDVK